MRKQIVYIHRADFDKRPPVISAIYNLVDLGHNVILITTGITLIHRRFLESHGVVIHIVTFKTKPNDNVFLKTYYNIRYRRRVCQLLNKYSSDDNVLWIEGNYTYVALWGSCIRKYELILQIQELYLGYLQALSTKSIINSAVLIFMPEYNRAILYYFRFNLNKLPIILPNKPDFEISKCQLLDCEQEYKDFVNKVGDRKIILYQGLVCEERDLSPFMKAFDKISKDYVFVVVGKDYGMLSKYKHINPSLIHIDYLSAPQYLFFTSKAYIGIVTYEMKSLNSVYCAPNKIYEYASFGVPMIANDIPGLKYTVGHNKAGVVLNSLDVNSILLAVKNIEKKYGEYSNNARDMFDAINNRETIKKALEKL